MGQKMITGYTAPSAPPHISADDDAQMHRGNFDYSGILKSDGMLRLSVIDNNTVRLQSGMYCNQGYLVCVPGGTTEDIIITSGLQGLYRKDLIVSEFTRGGGDVSDANVFKVLTGTNAISQDAAQDPELTRDDLYSGGSLRQEALYRVTLFGAQIISTDRLAPVIAPFGQMIVLDIPQSSGTIPLETNTIYKATLTGDTAFTFPDPVDGCQNQIMLYLRIGAGTPKITVNWPPNTVYVLNVQPVFNANGYYRVVIEHDPLWNGWVVGVIQGGTF